MSYDVSIAITFFDESDSQIQSLIAGLSSLDQSRFEIIILVDNPNKNSKSLRRIAGDILEEFVLVINEKNIGIAASRNKALKLARGQWIAFVDGDDEINTEKLELLAQSNSDDGDVIIYDYIISREGSEPCLINLNAETWHSKEAISHAEILNHFFNHCTGRSFFPFVWSKLYRRKFLIEQKVCFDENLAIYEDIDFLLRLLARAPKIKHREHQVFYTKKEPFPDKSSALRIIQGGYIFTKILANPYLDWRSATTENDTTSTCGLFFLKRAKDLIDQRAVLTEEQIKKFVTEGIAEPAIRNGIDIDKIESLTLKTYVSAALNGTI